MSNSDTSQFALQAKLKDRHKSREFSVANEAVLRRFMGKRDENENFRSEELMPLMLNSSAQLFISFDARRASERQNLWVIKSGSNLHDVLNLILKTLQLANFFTSYLVFN